ncbi:acryloyl-CoA reductase [Bacillaceae bacterium SIJ1]|uniref:acrylyl-CoA reductase family protein n=1 Tax=Litoribacterium kuwaitense TaxID=1398745 RepID=UPI0013EA89FF|nr:acryloyl-CoA reductase [Litoribacterium kuwaitense]NGP44789.1 acryloyl-CoA reductase [Litoribacterium kuwaitense]
MKSSFTAYVVEQSESEITASFKQMTDKDLPKGDVTIDVAYSSVNYKDGLAVSGEGRIIRDYPMVPGIDLSGTVISSEDPRFYKGQEVIATSYGLGVSHFGGYSEYARVPAEWVVPLPQEMSLLDAMSYGTAGLTAGLSVHALEAHGICPDDGEVLVTGATGGVGSMAVAMLSKRGYQVVASTGKEAASDFLTSLGADRVISREALQDGDNRPLQKQKWAAAVDPVGGASLARILASVKYQGAVAVSGLTGGGDVPTTVFPFILRGVSLFGIDSVECPMPKRSLVWKRLATDLSVSAHFNDTIQVIPLDDIPQALEAILQGKAKGRWVVDCKKA